MTQKRKALAFAEIVVIIFFIIAVSCVLIGNVFGVSQESKVIYNWKKTLDSANYSYKVILMAQKDELENFVRDESEERNINILNLIRDTLNTDTIINVNEQKSLNKYKYRFLNGKKVSETSKYYVKDFTYSPDGKIMVGLNWIESKCFETDELCGVMLFDMNGVKLPNRFGLDVFGVNIYKDRLEPFGTGLSYSENQRNCRRFETGVTCSKFYLMGGQFFK